MKKFFRNPTIWKIFLAMNLLFAMHNALYSVLTFYTERVMISVFFGLASLIHVRMIFICEEVIKKLEDNND